MFIAIPSAVTYQWYKKRDGTIEELATRYGTTVDEIRKLSGPFFEGKDISTTDKFVAELKYKHSVMIPVARVLCDYDWELWQFGSGTQYRSLDDLCKAVNKDPRRVLVAPLGSMDLLTSVANISTLLELWSLQAADHNDPHPAISSVVSAYPSFCPTKLVLVLVPIPRVSSGIGVAVTPKGTKPRLASGTRSSRKTASRSW
ncbi:MAG: hypothetical protein U0271_38250 [Polyangiaceae bacterium]